MRVLRAGDYREMPWKNGGGTTTEIAVFPAGAGLEEFDWRISMARVEGGGPFSLFAGVDRTLAILEGEGIVLKVDGSIPIGLTARSEPLPFPADVPTSAALIGGPVTDLNVMSRRSRVSHCVERLVISTPVEVPPTAEHTLVFCHHGNVEVPGSANVRLGPLDTLHLGGGQSGLRLDPAGDATLFIIGMNTPR